MSLLLFATLLPVLSLAPPPAPPPPLPLAAPHADTVPGLRGRVLDQLTGEPVPDAVVHVEGSSLWTLTDRSGSFAFGPVPPGIFSVAVRHPDYAPRTPHMLGGAVEPLELRVVRGPAVGMEGGEAVATVEVRDESGMPVPGAFVVAPRAMRGARTDENGIARLSGLPDGPDTLQVGLTGYRPGETAVVLRAGAPALAAVTLSPRAVRRSGGGADAAPGVP